MLEQSYIWKKKKKKIHWQWENKLCEKWRTQKQKYTRGLQVVIRELAWRNYFSRHQSLLEFGLTESKRDAVNSFLQKSREVLPTKSLKNLFLLAFI